MSQKSVTEEIKRLRRDSREWLNQITEAIKAMLDAEPSEDGKEHERVNLD